MPKEDFGVTMLRRLSQTMTLGVATMREHAYAAGLRVEYGRFLMAAAAVRDVLAVRTRRFHLDRRGETTNFCSDILLDPFLITYFYFLGVGSSGSGISGITKIMFSCFLVLELLSAIGIRPTEHKNCF